MSNDTVKKRVDGFQASIKKQLYERVRIFPYSALQLDESAHTTRKRPYFVMLGTSKTEIFFQDILLISSLLHIKAEKA